MLRRLNDLKLVRKFALLLAAAGLIVASLSFFALQRILIPAFEEIEHKVNDEQIARARFALDNVKTGLAADSLDYSVWDDMYEYVWTRDPAFVAETFTPLILQNQKVEIAGMIYNHGAEFELYVIDSKKGVYLPAETAHVEAGLKSKVFLATLKKDGIATAYLRSPRGVYAVAASRIIKSDESGDSRSFYVTGKRLSEASLGEALQTKVRLDLNVDRNEAEALLANPAVSATRFEDAALTNRLGLVGMEGQVLGIVDFSTPRTISNAGEQAVQSAILALALCLLILIGILGEGINRISVKRLRGLRNHVASFRAGRRVIDPNLLASGDEIGTLARQFDKLADELAEAEEELRRNSYVQGKADSAVGLLHNVRNALVPLQVKYEKWQQEDRTPLRGQLVQALDELAGDSCPAERRAALDAFAKGASRKLAEQGAARGEEIVDIKHSVDQILAILAEYNFDSSAKPNVEAVDVGALLRREAANLETATGTTVSLILPDAIPPVLANHIHLSQIVTNVLLNAAEAMKAGGKSDWTLSVDAAENPEAGTVEIAINDNGEGADANVLAHAFERGFSTRSDRSSGMGLHWSSNTARAMGGELKLKSEGPGKGATVRLRLPLAQPAITALAA